MAVSATSVTVNELNIHQFNRYEEFMSAQTAGYIGENDISFISEDTDANLRLPNPRQHYGCVLKSDGVSAYWSIETPKIRIKNFC